MMLTSAKFNVEVLVSADFSSLAPAKHSSVELGYLGYWDIATVVSLSRGPPFPGGESTSP